MAKDKLKKHNRKAYRNKKKKKYLYVMLILLIIFVLMYFLFSSYYDNHFYKNTVINGIDASNMTVDQVEKAINEKVKTYSLTLEERNDISEQIKEEDIGLHIVLGTSPTDIMREQNKSSWLSSLFKTSGLDINASLAYDKAKLKDQFDDLMCFDEANVMEPANAYISEYGNNGYEIIPEVPGTKIKADIFYDAVDNSILALESSISLGTIACYEEPEITSEYPKLINAVNEMNKLAGSKITYEFGDDIETVDGERISEWISVTDDYKVNLDEEGIKEFVDYIGKNYNSFGRTRTFKTSYGDVLQISGGDYGWWLNRVQEISELKELILAGAQQVKTPAYYQTAQQYGDDDIGSTYVEINLTAQHLFFYKDGSLIVEADIVSGNVSKDFGTPVGTYPVQYEEKDAILVGEDYASPVKYWMPFNKNIGLHDASWRDEFGKDIYLTNGSHGCINMPPAAAKKVFENIARGVAVVVYELPGTENYEVEETAT